jgi:hypothetical protein
MYCPDFILRGGDVSWRQAGPLVIHPLIYHFPKIVYRQEFEHSQVQKFAYALVLAHFLKRELETVLWVLLHRPVVLQILTVYTALACIGSHMQRCHSEISSKSRCHIQLTSCTCSISLVRAMAVMTSLTSTSTPDFIHSSAHYHLLSGALLAGAIYGPWYSAGRVVGSRLNETNWLVGWTGLWFVRSLFHIAPLYPTGS